jgi:uncharacterized protein GlcG (DUF336 family)
MRIKTLFCASALCLLPFTTQAEEALSISVKRLTMESALKIAQAAVEACRQEGIQVGVTVVDRGGHPQAVLRDTVAPDLTLTVSRQKAYTAMSFNAATSTLERRFETPFAVGKIDGLVMSAGGVPIMAGGHLYGAVGVSGAPSGETDEKCAQAGVDAVLGDLEMTGF